MGSSTNLKLINKLLQTHPQVVSIEESFRRRSIPQGDSFDAYLTKIERVVIPGDDPAYDNDRFVLKIKLIRTDTVGFELQQTIAWREDICESAWRSITPGVLDGREYKVHGLDPTVLTFK